MVRTAVVVLLIAASMLAGCVQEDEIPDANVDSGDADDSQGPGSLSGTILTIHLDPVKDGRVQLVRDGALVVQTTTNDQGEYSIQGIEPGDYVLQINAPCCREAVQAVTVAEDEETSVSVQLEILSDDDLQTPRVETYDWTGFLACTVNGVVIGVNTCGLVDFVAEEAGQENATDDNFLHVWTLEEGLKSVVGAMQWQAPGAALGDQLNLLMEVDGRWNLQPLYVNVEGTSPLEFRVDAGYVTANYDKEDNSGHNLHQYDFDNVEDSLDVSYRIFAGGAVNLVYQQQFTVYWDLYYWQSAPEDATALPDL